MRELIVLYLNKLQDRYTWTEFKYWFGRDKVTSFKYLTNEQILEIYTDIIRASSMPRAG